MRKVKVAFYEASLIRYVLGGGKGRGTELMDADDVGKALALVESAANQLAVDPVHSEDYQSLHAIRQLLRITLARINRDLAVAETKRDEDRQTAG